MVRTKADDDHEQKVHDDIEKYGWHCVNIIAEGDDGPYSFSVGLQKSYNHPELIIFGLSSEISHEILSLAVTEIQNGRPFDLNIPTSELLNDYVCVFVQVPKSEFHENVGFCLWYYHGDDFTLYQIVWPNRAGHFPWHSEVSASFRKNQPVLGSSAR